MWEFYAALGVGLKDTREKQKIGISELAKLAGVSVTFLTEIEAGKRKFQVHTLNKILLALDPDSDSVP